MVSKYKSFIFNEIKKYVHKKDYHKNITRSRKILLFLQQIIIIKYIDFIKYIKHIIISKLSKFKYKV